ncbi:hypothetical protein V495_08295 [Pseudogymnoascus sp. VKM F-4514 (FW-929)]|nr:hypothetical protein V495_08295 [Pseudogymnoascus sp. VKM F-4514 (FW-929)]
MKSGRGAAKTENTTTMDAGDKANPTEEMSTDQYHHFIPRFILRKFAQPCLKMINVWNWYTGNVSTHAIKGSFGMVNLYNSDTKSKTTNDNHVEKLFADLECAMGAIVKKTEDVLAPPSKPGPVPQRSVPLLPSEVSTIYKFISLSEFRNGPLLLRGPYPDSNREKAHQEWVARLKFFLQESHDELLAMDELLQPDAMRPMISEYKQIGKMKLHFWTTPKGEEFLLGNLLIGSEGGQDRARNSVPTMIIPAHIYIPVSPEILIVLCEESLCQHSLLKNAQHGVTTPFNRPAKGKAGKTEGRRRFQPIVYNWKTSYPITQLSVNDFRIITKVIVLPSSILVFRSRFAVDYAINNILLFSDTYTTWSKEHRGPSRNKVMQLFKEILQIIKEGGERHDLTWRLTRESLQFVSENTDGKTEEKLISIIEELGKATLVSGIDYHRHNYMFCKPGMYFMGDKKLMPYLRAAFWRGGVCNALIVHKADLPRDRAAWQPIFAAAMGSPDPYGRQLNGMGGGVSSLSKICIVCPSARQDADVDFEFVQVVIEDGQLDLASNCGNMTAAIGPFSIDNGLLKKPVIESASSPGPSSCTVRIFNTNTRKIIHSTFSVSGDPLRFHPGGTYEMAGVAGAASRICLSFISPGGTQTDNTLPTGSGTTVMDTRDEQGLRIQASLIDLANPGVHVDGRALGLDSSTTPLDLDKLHHKMALLEEIRREGAEKMGLDPDIASVPKIVICLPPTAEAVSKGVHIQCLVLSMGQTHKAIPLTLALNLGAACKIEGTIPFVLANGVDAKKDVTIQHPSGAINVGVELNGKEVESAVLYSTARLLMLGEVNIET